MNGLDSEGFVAGNGCRNRCDLGETAGPPSSEGSLEANSLDRLTASYQDPPTPNQPSHEKRTPWPGCPGGRSPEAEV